MKYIRSFFMTKAKSPEGEQANIFVTRGGANSHGTNLKSKSEIIAAVKNLDGKKARNISAV